MPHLCLWTDAADPAAGLSRNGSCGLVGMQERVRLLHGRLNLTSQTGAGTRVCVEFPLAETDSAPTPVNGAAVAEEEFSSVDHHPTPTESPAHATLP